MKWLYCIRSQNIITHIMFIIIINTQNVYNSHWCLQSWGNASAFGNRVFLTPFWVVTKEMFCLYLQCYIKLFLCSFSCWFTSKALPLMEKFFFDCSTTSALSSSTAVRTFFWDCTTAVHKPKSLFWSCCSCRIGCNNTASLDSWLVPISWIRNWSNIHYIHFIYMNVDESLRVIEST